METAWDKIALNKVLTKSELLQSPISSVRYNQIGIQLWGKGAYAREPIDGINTSYKLFNRLVSGDVVFNKIWARNGAVTVVFEEFDGYYVSTEFPVFHINRNILEPKWMLFATKQKWFWDACTQQAFGTSGKNRIKPENFLMIEIPIPTLPTQNKNISKIEYISKKIEAIIKIRKELGKDIDNLLLNRYYQIIENSPWQLMKDVAPIVRRSVEVREADLYPEIGVRCFGKGTFHKQALSGLEVGTKKIFQIKKGDLIFSNVFAWEGGIAVAGNDDNDRYGSHRFISCVPIKRKALSEFLCFHFLTQKGLEDINACSPGGAGRNKTLGLNKLMNIKVPTPSIEIQNDFVKLVAKVNAIKLLQTENEKELEDLMPALLDKAFKGGL